MYFLRLLDLILDLPKYELVPDEIVRFVRSASKVSFYFRNVAAKHHRQLPDPTVYLRQMLAHRFTLLPGDCYDFCDFDPLFGRRCLCVAKVPTALVDLFQPLGQLADTELPRMVGLSLRKD